MKSLKSKRIVFLVEDGYEDLECWYPKIRLEEEGIETIVASRSPGVYNSKHGYPIEATADPSSLNLADIDGLIIPGGTGSPDKLRRSKEILEFVKNADRQQKIVAIICHAGWVAISAGILNGKSATGFKAIKDDLTNAGVNYINEPVVIDQNLVSSRHPGDLPEFVKAIISLLSELH